MIKSINRIKWRVLHGGWKTDEKDVSAINHIIDFTNKKYDNILKDNDLIKKLFIAYIDLLVKTMKLDLEYSLSYKEICKEINKPVDYWFQKIHRSFNNNEQIRIWEELALSNNHPATLHSKIKKEEKDRIIHETMNKKRENQFFGESIERHKIESFINDMLFLILENDGDR